jgi:hypothetical protein
MIVNFVSELNTTCEEDVPVHEWNCEFLTKRNFAANKKRQAKKLLNHYQNQNTIWFNERNILI